MQQNQDNRTPAHHTHTSHMYKRVVRFGIPGWHLRHKSANASSTSFCGTWKGAGGAAPFLALAGPLLLPARFSKKRPFTVFHGPGLDCCAQHQQCALHVSMDDWSNCRAAVPDDCTHHRLNEGLHCISYTYIIRIIYCFH